MSPIDPLAPRPTPPTAQPPEPQAPVQPPSAPPQQAGPARQRDAVVPSPGGQKATAPGALPDPFGVASAVDAFEAADGNHDGVLSGSELASKDLRIGRVNGVPEVGRKEYLAARDEEAFQRLDGNQDGVLSGAEVREGAERYLPGHKPEVSRAEFMAGRAAERAARYDRNGDGYLSGNEIPKELEHLAYTAADGRKIVSMAAVRGEALGVKPQDGGGGPHPTARSARQAADELFQEQGAGRAPSGFSHRAREVRGANRFLPEQMAAAERQVQANAPAEAEQRGRLSPEQQQQYDHLVEATQKGGHQGGPDQAARLALQLLLLEGKLTGGKPAANGDSLLAALERQTREPVAAGIERERMIADEIQEIASPSCISQRNRGTCAATAVQIKAAMEIPAQYASVVGQLASPEGRARLADGSEARRVEGTAQQEDDDVLRTQSSRLFQAAMMAYANDGQYSNRTDANGQGQRGLAPGQVGTIMHGMWNREVQTYQGGDLLGQVARQANQGNPVPLNMAWNEEGHHEVLVTRVDPAAHRVYFTNPHGSEEVMSTGEFMQRAYAINVLGQP